MSEAAKFHAVPSLVDNAHTDQIKRKSRTVKYKLKTFNKSKFNKYL